MISMGSMNKGTEIKGLFSAMDISASGMTAMRTRMNITAANIANAESTRTEEGGPYKRQEVVLAPGKRAQFLSLFREEHLRMSKLFKRHLDNDYLRALREEYAQGVKVEEIAQDKKPPKLVYDPSHPDADKNGNVAYPNINMVTEMTNMMTAVRSYEANVTAINAAKNMMTDALRI